MPLYSQHPVSIFSRLLASLSYSRIAFSSFFPRKAIKLPPNSSALLSLLFWFEIVICTLNFRLQVTMHPEIQGAIYDA